MANMAVPREVDRLARLYAVSWLKQSDYCECPPQVQLVARRLVPIVAMFQRELLDVRRDYTDEVRRRLDIYSRYAGRALARELHRPGASAALDDDRRTRLGIGTTC